MDSSDRHPQLILPFLVGVYCLIAHQYSLDPVMGIIGLSEYTFMNIMRVREPYVRKLLIKRSAWILLLTLVIGRLRDSHVFICTD
jgi:hypothetical protein